MIEKVNPSHPDKVADRIAGSIVDLAYAREKDPKIAVEVLIGHGKCYIIIESNIEFKNKEQCEDVFENVYRIIGSKEIKIEILYTPQDVHLADNQVGDIRCGDNGIFKGVPITYEEKEISRISKIIYDKFKTDGKYILHKNNMIICQSNAKESEIKDLFNESDWNLKINPLGEWTGGTDVDTGATNRKLGSDMGNSVTGGGLHGKDLSKTDVSANIYAFLKAQETGSPVELYCAIGDTELDGRPYGEIVEIARNYIKSIGGFEKLAEWGLF